MNNLSNVLTLLDAIPQNVVVYSWEDDDFIFTYFNEQAEITENISREKIIGKRLIDLFPKVKEFGLYEVLLRVKQTGVSEELNLGFYEDERISGWRYNKVNRLDSGDIVVIYSDMTKQKDLEKKSLIQKEKLQNLGSIIDNSINEVYIFDAKDFHFTYINTSAEKNIGYTLDEMKELTPVDIKPEHTLDSFTKLLEPLLQKKEEFVVFETVHERKDSSKYNVEVRLQLMSIDNQEQIVVLANNITERKNAQEKLQRLATLDSLTGIYNRHKISEELDIEMARVKRYDGSFALLMLDIDYFKEVNDTYGHDVGDSVLKEFTSVVSECIRESDRFGRWGGEEFIIIFPEIDKDSIIDLSEKLGKDIEMHKFKDIKQLTVSIGATIFQKGDIKDTKESILKQVDNALYEAKNAGRNTIRFN